MVSDQEWLLPDEAEAPRRLLQRFRPHLVAISLLGLLILVIAMGPPSVTRPSSFAALPPIDQQLLWLPASPDPQAVRLRAVDWTGEQLGTLALPCRAPCSFAPSPDGQRVLIAEQLAQGEQPTPGAVYDALGRRVGPLIDPAARWADDSRHLCLLRAAEAPANAPPTGSQVELDILDLEGGHDRVVASVAGVISPLAPAFWDLLACSFKSDRAVLAFTEQQAIRDIRVLQLSTGRVLYARDDVAPGASCGCPIKSMAAAPNADIAAENLAGGGAQIVRFSTGASSPWPPDGRGSDDVLGLSWRGQRALTSTGIFDTSSGRLVWRGPSAASVAIAASRPGSDDLLLYLSGPNGFAPSEVIVLEDGRSLLINTTIPAAG